MRDSLVKDNDHIIENENVSIDVSMLYEVSCNDKNFVYTTIKTFLKNMPDTLDNLQKSSDTQDWDNVYRYAHSAKSSLSVIKIAAMFSEVLKVELHSKDKTSLHIIPDLIKNIKERYFQASNLLKERFEA